MCKFGADAIGRLDYESRREAKQHQTIVDIDEVCRGAMQQNKAMATSLKPDAHAGALLAEIVAEAKLNRMEPPQLWSCSEHANSILTRRFAVVQGAKPDGTSKIRAIDDFTESRVNSCCEPTKKLTCENIDSLVAMSKARWGFSKRRMNLWKADMKSA